MALQGAGRPAGGRPTRLLALLALLLTLRTVQAKGSPERDRERGRDVTRGPPDGGGRPPACTPGPARPAVCTFLVPQRGTRALRRTPEAGASAPCAHRRAPHRGTPLVPLRRGGGPPPPAPVPCCEASFQMNLSFISLLRGDPGGLSRLDPQLGGSQGGRQHGGLGRHGANIPLVGRGPKLPAARARDVSSAAGSCRRRLRSARVGAAAVHARAAGARQQAPAPCCLLSTPCTAPCPLPLRSKIPCYDFMYCHAAEGPIFKGFAELEMLETL